MPSPFFARKPRASARGGMTEWLRMVPLKMPRGLPRGASLDRLIDVVRERRREILILLSLCALYFLSYFHRVGVPGTIFDELQKEFSASAGAIALLGTIYIYIYAFVQIPTGVMADRFGAPRVILAGGLFMLVGAVIFPLAHSIPALYVARGLIGLGGGMMYVSLVKEVDVLCSPRNFTVVLGFVLFLGYSGGLAGTFPFERAVRMVGWRDSMMFVAGLSFLALVVAWFVLRYSRHLEAVRPTYTLMVGAVLKNRESMPILVGLSTNFAIYFTIQAIIGKKLLTDCCGISSGAAASITFAMMLVALVSLGSSGVMSRLIGNRRRPLAIAAAYLAIIGALMLIAGLQIRSPALVAAGYLVLAATAISSPVAAAAMKELNHPDAAGTAVGVMNALAYLTVAIMGTIAGLILDQFADVAVVTERAVVYPVAAYQAILWFSAAVGVISLAAMLRLRETHGRNIHETKQPIADGQ